MSERKPFLLRLDPATMAALKAWAADDLRSLNGQIEYLLRGALRDAGRLPANTQRRSVDRAAAPEASAPSAGTDHQRLRPPAARRPAAPEELAR